MTAQERKTLQEILDMCQAARRDVAERGTHICRHDIAKAEASIYGFAVGFAAGAIQKILETATKERI